MLCVCACVRMRTHLPGHLHVFADSKICSCSPDVDPSGSGGHLAEATRCAVGIGPGKLMNSVNEQ